MNSSRLPAFARCGIAAAAAVLLLQGAHAASITNSVLAEIPLQGINPVKPNIMFTLDDSGSMAWDFVPDYVAYVAPGIAHCRDGNQCGGATGVPADQLFVFTQYDPPVRSSAYNNQFYDPSAVYLPGKRDDGTNLPYEGANPGTWTSVYRNGFAGYPGANIGTINLTTGYLDTAWCNSQASNPPSAADLLTASGDGSKCRLNGRAYAKYTEPSNLWSAPAVAAGYNYPNVKDVTTGVNTACALANEYCIFKVRGTVSANPYYYTISKVQFCSNKDALGYGTPPCQDSYENTTYKYVRYGTNAAMAFDPQAFTRVDIVPATPSYPSGRTYAAEMANFAKWYTFYRTRILGMKTAAGIAFSALSDEDARVGFHTLWENGSAAAGFLNVVPFSDSRSASPSTNKPTWFSHLYAVSPQLGTSLPDALYRIGEYFANSGNSGLPGATDPLDATTGMCQANYHLMSTDGYWNYVLGSSIGDKDQNVPATLPGAIPGFTPGSPFPRPYFEGPTATSNNLADLAMHYWIRDLRPGLANNVKDTIAPWQHVTLYGLSVGAQGSLPYPSGIDDITSGVKNWPTTLTGSPGQYLGPAPGPEAIDDLWHAAINSRGKFFNAKSPQELAESIVSALADFTDQSGTGTSVGIAGAQFTATRHFGYKASYEAGWWGDVKKYALDPATGALPVDSAGNPVNPPLWSAATKLDAQVLGAGWDTARRILTINDSSNVAVPFRHANLSGGQQTSLNAGWSVVSPQPTSQAVLDYLRGDKTNEGVGSTNFRVRAHVLGDIGYSGAVAVGAPSQPYLDAGNPGYQNYVTTRTSRTPMVYVGGNDGMVHAFDDSTGPDAGKESWAFVPKALYSGGNPNDSNHAADPAFQLGALSYRRGGIPLFAHKFYVNATPRAWDVDFANTNTSTPPQSGNDWRTILVGGLGAGGRSVYALDVTTPPVSTDTESTIASSGRVLWEFTDANLGYVFDAPTLVKTYAYGWVVLVTSGYNNPGGKGFLYVLNPTTGQLVHPTYGKIALLNDTGTDIDPTGLSTVRAYTASRRDPYVLQAYSGDLKGNVWRFDLADANPANWRVDLIAKLTDASGTAQPITTGVRIEIDQNNNIDRYLFVGTGKLLGPNDIASNTVRNTLYVIRDGTRTAAEAAPATPYSRSDLNSVNGAAVAGFAGTPTGRGWYQDAADPTEKIGSDVYADVQTVVWSFSKPATDPCAAPISSRLYARDLNTGSSVLEAPTGGIVAGYDIGSGIAGVGLIQGQAGTGSSASGDVRALVTTMKGEVFSFGIRLTPTTSAKHRVSWRLLNRD